MPRIGELLVADGVVTEGAVQSALGCRRHTGEPVRLGTILLDRDLLPEENLLRALSAIHRCDYVTSSASCPSAPPSGSPRFPMRSKVAACASRSRTLRTSPQSTKFPRSPTAPW